MAGWLSDPGRAPVAFGRRAVPRLFEQLQQPEAGGRLPGLAALCDLLHDPEQIHHTVRGGFLEQLPVLLTDQDPAVRTKTCELLHVLTAHTIGRTALLASALLPPLALLLDDSSSSCRSNVHRVLNRLSLLSAAGAEALLPLVPKLMLKLREEEEEEEEVLLLSTLSSCSSLDPLPALASDGVSLFGHKLSHRSAHVRREAAAAMMALSVCEDGKQQVCEQDVLPVLVGLLQDEDVEVQVNAAGVIMYTAVLTTGKRQCLDLNVIPVLLELLSKEGKEEQEEEEEEEQEERRRRRKALLMFSLQALTALAEAPAGRRLLQEQLPLLEARSSAAEEDRDVREAAQTAVRIITWTP